MNEWSYVVENNTNLYKNFVKINMRILLVKEYIILVLFFIQIA
jgi:hypothetical protein